MSENDAKCCNPFGTHKETDPGTKDLRVIRESDNRINSNLVVGQMWCGSCRKKEARSKVELHQDEVSTSSRLRFALVHPTPSSKTAQSTSEAVGLCHNPYNMHETKTMPLVKMRKTTEKDAQRVSGLLIGEWWCSACRKRPCVAVAASSDNQHLTQVSASGSIRNVKVPRTEISASGTGQNVEEILEKHCCNPLKIHDCDNLVTENLKLISEKDSEKNEGLLTGEWWCDLCQSKFDAQHSQNQAEKTENLMVASDSDPNIDFSSIIVPSYLTEDAGTDSPDMCCNPYSIHTGVKRDKGLRLITNADGKSNSALNNLIGKSWCGVCRKHKVTFCSYTTVAKHKCSGVIKPVHSLSSDERRALAWNTGLWENITNNSICEKHFHIYVGVYKEVEAQKTNRCCNPLKLHRKGSEAASNLYDISICGVLRAKEKNIVLTYGEKYCASCRSEIMALPNSGEGHTPSLSQGSSAAAGSSVCSPAVTHEIQLQQVKDALSSLGVDNVSGVGKYRNTEQGRISEAKRHIEAVTEVAKKKICASLAVSKDDVKSDNDLKAQHFYDLMGAVKAQIPLSSKNETYQLLGLYPSSMPVREGAKFFGVSRTLLTSAMTLRQEKGLLATPTFKRTPLVSEETRDLVVKFYCDDRHSKLLPGVRDVVSLGGGKHEQKRLLLCNLHELYYMFKSEFSLFNINKSFFCSLRPKWCVSAGAKGVHAVCVCQTHQDIKLILHALHVKEHYREIIKLCVCDDKNRECMLRICSNCPNPEQIGKVIEEKMVASFFPPSASPIQEITPEQRKSLLDGIVEYHQWKSTDRAEMVSLTCSREDLINVATEQMLKLIPHDFVARAQSEYMKKLKEDLDDSTLIITMDFGMNYSCLIQGEIQSYHWSKKQVTIHPVVIFYKENGELKHRTIVFISDDLDHDADLVQVIQDKIMEIVKQDHPNIKYVEYFTDGCAAQYKNKRSFLSLCEHKKKYGVTAKYNYFATSHGKGQCDSASATVKRIVAYASLQRPLERQIINPQDVYDFCKSSNLNMQFEMVYKVDKKREAAKLGPKLVAVPGTRSFHQYIPLNDDTVECKFTSFDEKPALLHCLRQVAEDISVTVGSFVLVKVARKKFVGYITDCEEQDEVELTLLHPKLPASKFTWPNELNTVIVPIPHIIDKISMVELPDNKYELSYASKQMLIARHILHS